MRRGHVELVPELVLAAGVAAGAALDSLAESLLLSEPLAGLASADLPSALLSAAGFAAGLLPDPLKSVAYHPLPFSWNPAAETSFVSVSLPQDGQVVSGASASFSGRWPRSA